MDPGHSMSNGTAVRELYLFLINVQGRRRRTLSWILIASAFASSVVWWLLAVLGAWDAPLMLRSLVFIVLGTVGLGLRMTDRGETEVGDDRNDASREDAPTG